jgi:hypothetical protein
MDCLGLRAKKVSDAPSKGRALCLLICRVVAAADGGAFAIAIQQHGPAALGFLHVSSAPRRCHYQIISLEISGRDGKNTQQYVYGAHRSGVPPVTDLIIDTVGVCAKKRRHVRRTFESRTIELSPRLSPPAPDAAAPSSLS